MRATVIGLGLWVALVLAAALCAAPAEGSVAVALSPLNGTPDASPQTQISFLGIPAGEISHVSVVGSHSGGHSGKLEAYASSPGASFLPSHPFTQGVRVTASAVVGPAHHAQRVSTTFTVASLPDYRITVGKRTELSKASLVQSFVSQPKLN